MFVRSWYRFNIYWYWHNHLLTWSHQLVVVFWTCSKKQARKFSRDSTGERRQGSALMFYINTGPLVSSSSSTAANSIYWILSACFHPGLFHSNMAFRQELTMSSIHPFQAKNIYYAGCDSSSCVYNHSIGSILFLMRGLLTVRSSFAFRWHKRLETAKKRELSLILLRRSSDKLSLSQFLVFIYIVPSV